MAEQLQLSGVRLGPLQAGERITLTDPKGRRHSVVLTVGGQFHTAKGAVSHDDLISRPEGIVVSSTGGTQFLAMRPLLNEFTVSMPRGAAVIYPKDAAQILMGADIFPGARVLEAGAGSGALTCSLLRAIGPSGRLISYERREDFAAIARRNVENFFGASPPSWDLRVADLLESLHRGTPRPRGPRHARSVGVRRGVGRGARSGRGVLRLRRDHDPARRDGGDVACSQRLHRAGGHRVTGPRLARRGAGRTTAARYGRPHRICDHSTATGARVHSTVT